MRWTALIVVLVMLVGSVAGARGDVEFALAVGYGHMKLDGAASAFDDRGGARFEPRVSFNLKQLPEELRLGFGVGVSGYWNDLDDDDDDDRFFDDEAEALSLIEPEFQLSWRQPVVRSWGMYLEGGVGIGGVIGEYALGDDWWGSGGRDETEWDAAFEARPFIRLGIEKGRWVFGAETSYMFGGNLDFGRGVEGDVSEWFVGLFFGGRL